MLKLVHSAALTPTAAGTYSGEENTSTVNHLVKLRANIY